MAITLAAFVSTTTGPTIGVSEYSMPAASTSLATRTDTGIFQAFIDLNAMAAGDVFDFTVYEMTVSGGTKRKAWYARFASVAGQPVYVSPTLILGVGWDMTLIKISGTDRAIPFRIAQVA